MQQQQVPGDLKDKQDTMKEEYDISATRHSPGLNSGLLVCALTFEL